MSQGIIILQARMGSSRLPGKSLAQIGARRLVSHCLARLLLGSAAPVMLATTTNAEDDALAEAAAAYCVPVFRGPADDVLQRYALAARSVNARYVVRATADNPLTDIDGPERALRALRETGADYVVEEDLPYGAAVEAMTADALYRAAVLASDPSDREHVTLLMRRDHERFSALTIKAPAAVRRPDIRVTVDTADDLQFMRSLSARMNNWVAIPDLADAIRILDACRVESKVA
jgi:spore coat polysaccharide biosynthesis protein SpsF